MLLLYVIFLADSVFGKQTHEKRLLINDPDVSDLRMSHMEQQMVEIQTKYNDLLSKTTKLETYVQKLETLVQKQDQTVMSNGATYVRWGKTRCSGLHTELVYSGYAAGQYYYHPDYTVRWGGPANTLCLPDDPQLSSTTFMNTDSFIRGTEYEGNTFASDSQDEDVPCVVCRTINATTSIMIPGRQSCYPGWRLEYDGFLSSGHEGHSASEYICMDSNPEYIPSGKAGNDGHLFYMVNIKCGPLPCPPYAENRKVNCVVCSK